MQSLRNVTSTACPEMDEGTRKRIETDAHEARGLCERIADAVRGSARPSAVGKGRNRVAEFRDRAALKGEVRHDFTNTPQVVATLVCIADRLVTIASDDRTPGPEVVPLADRLLGDGYEEKLQAQHVALKKAQLNAHSRGGELGYEKQLALADSLLTATIRDKGRLKFELLLWEAVAPLVAERDLAVVERERADSERDRALAACEAALAERNEALAARDKAQAARDAALVERDQALVALRKRPVPAASPPIAKQPVSGNVSGNAMSYADAARAAGAFVLSTPGIRGWWLRLWIWALGNLLRKETRYRAKATVALSQEYKDAALAVGKQVLSLRAPEGGIYRLFARCCGLRGIAIWRRTLPSESATPLDKQPKRGAPASK